MRRLTMALLCAAAILVVPVSLAGAASVAPIPVPPGSQSCDSLAARFGVGAGIWKEIRFTEPTAQSLSTGSHTKTNNGNTVTITITSEGTVSFVSQLPIEAVYVNKGNGPTAANAIYRYVPPVVSDRDLGLKPVLLSGVDHVVLCWATPTPATTVTTTTTIVVPTSEAPTTLPTTPVTTNVVLPTVVERTTVPVTTTFVLPQTGSGTSTLVGLAALLTLAGLVVVLASRARHSSIDDPS
jgi:LPXTG-motif cell wall-anchored protein